MGYASESTDWRLAEYEARQRIAEKDKRIAELEAAVKEAVELVDRQQIGWISQSRAVLLLALKGGA